MYLYNWLGPSLCIENCRVPKVRDGGEHEKGIFHVFLSLCTARPSFEYYQQVYFVHSGLQDESLQVTISKLL